ncbi:MAG: hypothetical protein ACREJG_12255, partial [Candidatus Rokuibacteriota bacterium]
MRITTLQYAAGTFCAVIGAMMFVAPHHFYTPAYRVLQPELSVWGALFLVAGAGLLAAAALAPRPAVVVASHLFAGLALLT